MSPFPSASQSMKLRHRMPVGALPDHGTGAHLESGQDRRGERGDRQFDALRVAYRASGGVARGEHLAGWMGVRQSGDYASLARMIVGGEVISFEWNDSFWLPMFQFDPVDLSIRPGPRRVVDALAHDCVGWALAAWFARPNSRLNHLAPVDLLPFDLAAVLDAARADRGIATVFHSSLSNP